MKKPCGYLIFAFLLTPTVTMAEIPCRSNHQPTIAECRRATPEQIAKELLNLAGTGAADMEVLHRCAQQPQIANEMNTLNTLVCGPQWAQDQRADRFTTCNVKNTDGKICLESKDRLELVKPPEMIYTDDHIPTGEYLALYRIYRGDKVIAQKQFSFYLSESSEYIDTVGCGTFAEPPDFIRRICWGSGPR